MDWVNSFFIPLGIAIVGITLVGGISFLLIRALRKTWKTQTKWYVKFKILKRFNKYPDDVVAWCVNMIENGVGYYETKKFLYVKGVPEDKINGTMWIYDQLLIELKSDKSLKRNYSKIVNSTLPNLK